MMIGLLGGGQLGRMLALAGYPLGLGFRALDHNLEAPVRSVADLVVAESDDLEALARFADGLDVVTYEFENIPVSSARFLSERVPLFPPPEALECGQDRFEEKNFFQRLGIPTAQYREVNSIEDLNNAVERLGLPAVLKTRRLGYDGKGQFVLRSPDETAGAFRSLEKNPLILEAFVPFERELSILAVRGRTGETAFYPLVENQHEGGILRLSIAPSFSVSGELQSEAELYASRVLDALNYVGLLAIEFFLYDGRLYANEFAPRVHNSGHWTIEGAETSQFENHLRAILGLPLGSTAPIGYSAMINLIGSMPDIRAILALQNTHLHDYGKRARQGRKLGHVTIRTSDPESRLRLIGQVKGRI
jgi:5-(carboxyamino)imidazole ribonucleotide synthase